MVPKAALVLLLVLCTLCVEAQRDNRRRSGGRRKPTTEAPVEEPEPEALPQEIPTEKPEKAAPEISESPKEATTNNSSGPPFIAPRGTRKPRPMHVRGGGEGKPRPTLPTFTRKSSGGRMPKPDFKKTEENSLSASPTTSTTSKPNRGSSSRRRQSSEKTTDKTVPEKTDEEPSTEATPKKRFGGGGRRQSSRGSNRRVTPAEEA